MTVHTTCPSPLGELTLVADSDALAGLYFAGHAPAPAIALGPRDPGALVDAREQLAEYFAGGRSTFTLALAPRGIPYGETLTYAALATQLHAHPRAVGGASARNPLSIVVPCHRMVTSAGGLAGYGGGVERKRALLFHEGALS
jgi:methylated-DNA-[protein]-cysteine S-methyltransferase